MNHVFCAYLDHSLSNIYIGNIRLIYRTNCTQNRTKKHTQNKSVISDVYVGQIRCLEKKHTFCEPQLKKHGSQNVGCSFFQTADMYRINYGLNKLKKRGSQNVFLTANLSDI